MSNTKKPDVHSPTRRGFLALLGVTAVAVAVRLPPETARPHSLWVNPKNGKPRWIGHC